MAENPIENPQVRTLFGLLSGFAIALIAFLFFEGTTLLILLGVAVLEAILVPYFLKLAAASGEE